MKINLNLSEKNKFSSAVMSVVLAFIIAGVLSFIILGLRSFNLIELPAFIENLVFRQIEDPIEEKNDDRAIYDFLGSDGRDNNTAEGAVEHAYMFDITLENVKEVMESIIFPENVYISSEAKYYYKGEVSKVVETSLWKKGIKFRYFLTVDSHMEDLYINNGEYEYIQSFSPVKTAGVVKPVRELFEFKDAPNIQDINYYLGLIDNAEVINCAVVRYSESYENVVRIKYSIPDLNQREDIFISLDTGIVLEVRSYHGDNNDLYYQYIADVKEAYNDISEVQKTAISDEMFDIAR